MVALRRPRSPGIRGSLRAVVVAVAGLVAAAITVVAQPPSEPGRRPGSTIPRVRRYPQQSWPMLEVRAGARRFVAVTFDGHVHTAISRDATHPPADVVALAERVDLDAVMITDHGSSRAVDEVGGYTGATTPIVGAELGGLFGHALTWAFVEAPEHRGGQMHDMPGLADTVHSEGGLVVLAHPGWFIPGNPVNPRYYMQYDAIRRGGLGEGVDAIEVWNATYPARTESLVDEWLSLLDRSVYVPITCGTDFHRFGQVELGSPRNVALCPADGSATTPAGKRRCVLEAARAGRLFLTDGPIVDLQVDGRTFGEVVETAPGQRVRVYVRALAWQDVELRVRIGHTDVRTFPLRPGEVREERFELAVPADTYVLAEVVRTVRVEKKPTIALITNPIRLDTLPRVADWRGPSTTRPARIAAQWTRPVGAP